MQTLVIRITDELARSLDDEAKRCYLTKSEIARRRLATARPLGTEPTGFELIADLVGTVKGGPADMSVRKKDYLKSKSYGISGNGHAQPQSRR